MADATAFISAEDIQSSEDWYAWFFDRTNGYIQVSQDWYSWNFERAFIQLALETEVSSISASGDAIYLLEGLELQSELGTIELSDQADISINGIDLIIEQGNIDVLANASIDVSGLEATLELGKVTATGAGEMVMVPSRESYRKPTKSAVISIIGLDMASDVGKPVASGTIIINNSAKVFGIEARIEAKAVKAEGVLNLSDEEIILLMAA